MTVLVAFIGFAAGGAVLRHVVRVGLVARTRFPAGTLAVNLVGSFLLGLVVGWDPPGATLVGTAGLGALTTFSTFADDALELRTAGRGWWIAYVAMSNVGGVGLAWIGYALS